MELVVCIRIAFTVLLLVFRCSLDCVLHMSDTIQFVLHVLCLFCIFAGKNTARCTQTSGGNALGFEIDSTVLT